MGTKGTIAAPIPGTALPNTPSKHLAGSAAIERVIRKLNDDYGLAIDIPDPTLSPVRRQQLGAENDQYARCDRICRGIQFLYYQRGGVLNHALDAFFHEAKAASLCWVPKPCADPGTLPTAAAPPKAQTARQQLSLQTILVSVIDRFKAQRTPAFLITKTASPAGVQNEEGKARSPSLPDSPASTGSKRSFDSDSEHSAKRSRGKERAFSPCPSPTPNSTFIDALDKVPSRRRLGRPPVGWSPERRQQKEERSSSTDTSGSSRVSSLFSRGEGQQSAHTTLDGETWEEKRPLPAIPSPSGFSAAFRTPDLIRPVLHPPSAGRLADDALPPRSSGISTVYSDLSDTLVASVDPSRSSAWNRQVDNPSSSGEPSPLQLRLQNIWPNFPRWLHDAPLAVAWEITRICLHCKVDLEDDSLLKYDPTWATSDICDIWKSLCELDVFRGKSFPERPAVEAFKAALNNFETGKDVVVMSAALEFNPSKTGPLFLLDMKPVRLDQGCRLTRRFGPDRFLEVLIPSPTAQNAPEILKGGGSKELIAWLTNKPHDLVGRQWQAFYSKDAGYRKPAKDFTLGPDAKATYKERVHFFAEDGLNFRRVNISSRNHIPPDSVQRRTALSVSLMLDWLLQLEKNDGQPHLKLFSRIQLGLSKTTPTVTFEPDQIIHRGDILSPIGKVMNDGIGRMSRSVATKIRDALGLDDIPSAIQGRMGSAKGMWLVDVADTGDADWIETYESQRKWKCDFADAFHRTLEVHSRATELKSATLNLQFLPVLEDRAKDRGRMRRAIAKRLMNDLEKEFENQKSALKCPIKFRQWVSENSCSRPERVKFGRVPFLGGLPEGKGEVLTLLLNSGFDPNRLSYLQDLAWDLRKQKCDILKTKLNIKVGRSAYIYMVIDFWGVLEENEVHVGFSSKFRDESNDTSYMLLADCDVLVARSPAHFVSDVQKVRAVFKPELHALKDVIVFSAKGDVPLADKLSGGDYDGDMAWVCWDRDLVEDFVNSDVPIQPKLDVYLGKDRTTFEDLVRHTGQTGDLARNAAVYDMINKSFQFAMQPNYLGICTNYKERLCYHRNSVNDGAAILLSTLVGNLVDQSKQGIIFSTESWAQLRRDHFKGKMSLDDPAYKGDRWAGVGEPRHIIDYLKFFVAAPAIDRELVSLHKAMNVDKRSSATGSGEAAQPWDRDLAVYYEDFYNRSQSSRSLKALLDSLVKALDVVQLQWKRLIPSRDSPLGYPERVKQVYAQWLAIEPCTVGNAGSNRLDSKIAALLEQPFLADRRAAGMGQWALLKASTAFRLYYKRSPKFVWQMAGSQLAFIKAQISSASGGDEGVPLLMTPLMYAGSVPDGRFVKQYIARREGDGSEYPDLGDGEGDDGTVDRGDDVD